MHFDGFANAPVSPSEATSRLLPRDATRADRTKLTEVLTLLSETPTGKGHVQRVVQYGLEVRFDARDGGAVFNGILRRITLNRMKTSSRTATEFAHEAVHARSFNEGRAPNPRTQSRNAFVAGMIAEETQTYLEEAIVGRELLQFARIRQRPYWRELLTAHELQMYFQLLYGVPYQTRPSEQILDQDLALRPLELRQRIEGLRPYFRNYVSAYNRVEGIKWDIANGVRPPMDGTTMAELLTTSFSMQDPSFTTPRRPSVMASAARR